MEALTQDLGSRSQGAPLPPSASSVTPARPNVVTRPNSPEQGQDSRGGEGQGRSWEQAEAKRPLTFQDVLLSSTTLSNLREALDRFGAEKNLSQENRSVGRKGSKGDEGGNSSTPSSTVARDTAVAAAEVDGNGFKVINGAEDGDPDAGETLGGDGYYGPDWSFMSQMAEAAKRAVSNYRQSLSTTPDAPFARPAESVDLLA